MGMMKQLQLMNDEVQSFYESWQHFYDQVANSNPDQMSLDDYAIPDEDPSPQPVSLEATQKHLAEKARQGFSEQIRNLIQSYGVNKLSEIKPEDYTKLWKQVDDFG